MKKLTHLILAGLILFIFNAEISAQTNFTDVTNQPVFSYGFPGEWDDQTVWFPAVIKDGDTLRMWYTGADAIAWASPLNKIGYAWSLDGIEWLRYSQGPVLSPELPWEGVSLFGCAVIKDDDTLKMWYGATLNFGSPPSAIGYATSVDGKTWNKHPVPVLQKGPGSDWDDAVIQPTTVIKDGIVYKMWYWAGRPGFPQQESLPQTGLATSPDGINWTKYDDPSTNTAPYAFSDPVLKIGSYGEWDSHRVIDPMVLKKGARYEMWYAGLKAPINTSTKQQIGYAISEDGIVWQKYPDPVFTDPTEWGSAIYGGSILKYDEHYHLWFACFHSLTTQASPLIGYANDPQTCLPEGVTFSTQAEVDSFQDDYYFCTDIAGDVEISGNDIINLDGLSILRTIGGDLLINNNEILENLSGLDCLQSIGGNLKINSNSVLTDLTGLENLDSIDGDLFIDTNPMLTSLIGLDNIEPWSIADLTITNNNTLAYCHVNSICYYLINTDGSVDINNNAPNCNDSTEVRRSCPPPVTFNELKFSEKSNIYPNPFTQTVTIEYQLINSGIVQVTIYSHLGKQIDRLVNKDQLPGKHAITFDSSGLPVGIYFCVLKTERGTQTMKIVKLK